MARGVVLKAMGDVEVIEDTTGDLVDILSATAGADRNSDSSVGQQYAAAAGACINWRTNTVHRGRRIKGRTFLVPLRGAAFEDNGTLSNATITSLTTAATALTNPPVRLTSVCTRGPTGQRTLTAAPPRPLTALGASCPASTSLTCRRYSGPVATKPVEI